ncbi:hypothetical protein [Streptomyces sp. NBC_01320]|nr:hypothetical protein OG395_43465 [Streptomyces sp. NBC_01320]
MVAATSPRNPPFPHPAHFHANSRAHAALLHHGAEIALLRNLFRARQP